MTVSWPFFSPYSTSSGIDRDPTSTDAHLEPAVTPMQNSCKFTLEWSYYKLFPLKYVFISDSLQVLLRKLVKRKKNSSKTISFEKPPSYTLQHRKQGSLMKVDLNVFTWDQHLIQVNLPFKLSMTDFIVSINIYKADIKIIWSV